MMNVSGDLRAVSGHNWHVITIVIATCQRCEVGLQLLGRQLALVTVVKSKTGIDVETKIISRL